MPIVLVDSPGGTFWRQWQEYVENHLLKQGLISPPDLHLYKITDSVAEAAREFQHFYSNYHSLRYSRDEIILRLHRKPTESQVAEIAEQFSDIKVRGAFRVSGPLSVERDEAALNDLHRLVFVFNRREHGRLRQLIDHLNDLPN